MATAIPGALELAQACGVQCIDAVGGHLGLGLDDLFDLVQEPRVDVRQREDLFHTEAGSSTAITLWSVITRGICTGCGPITVSSRRAPRVAATPSWPSRGRGGGRHRNRRGHLGVSAAARIGRLGHTADPRLLQAHQGQAYRVTYAPRPSEAPLPTDRESVFYFNLLDIPPKPTDAAGHVLLAREFGAQAPQRIEQRQVLRQHRQAAAMPMPCVA